MNFREMLPIPLLAWDKFLQGVFFGCGAAVPIGLVLWLLL